MEPVFILVIAALVQLLETVLRKYMPPLEKWLHGTEKYFGRLLRAKARLCIPAAFPLRVRSVMFSRNTAKRKRELPAGATRSGRRALLGQRPAARPLEHCTRQ